MGENDYEHSTAQDAAGLRAEAGRIMAAIPPEKTREADYVWLPFRFEGDMAFLDWRDEWRIEEFD